jgi:hypothetical protein
MSPSNSLQANVDGHATDGDDAVYIEGAISSIVTEHRGLFTKLVVLAANGLLRAVMTKVSDTREPNVEYWPGAAASEAKRGDRGAVKCHRDVDAFDDDAQETELVCYTWRIALGDGVAAIRVTSIALAGGALVVAVVVVVGWAMGPGGSGDGESCGKEDGEFGEHSFVRECWTRDMAGVGSEKSVVGRRCLGEMEPRWSPFIRRQTLPWIWEGFVLG